MRRPHLSGHGPRDELAPGSHLEEELPCSSNGKESACGSEDPGSIPWRREWQPSPVFLPGEFHGQRNLAGCSSWGHTKLDTTERLTVLLLMTLKHELQNVLGEGSLDFYPTYHIDGKSENYHFLIDLENWIFSHSIYAVVCASLVASLIGPWSTCQLPFHLLYIGRFGIWPPSQLVSRASLLRGEEGRNLIWFGHVWCLDDARGCRLTEARHSPVSQGWLLDKISHMSDNQRP